MAAPRARLGGVRIRVLQPVGVEASVVHPADVRAAGPRRRRPAADAEPRRRSLGRRCRAQSSSVLSRWRLLVGVRPDRRAPCGRAAARGNPRSVRTLAQGRGSSSRRSGARARPCSAVRRYAASDDAPLGALLGDRRPRALHARRRRRSPSPGSTRSARRARHRLSSGRRRPQAPFVARRTRSIRSRCTTRPFPSTSAARRRWSPTATSSPSGSTPSPSARSRRIATMDRQWRARQRRLRRAAARRDYERLAADGVPMRVLARDSRRVIVSRK